MEGIDLDFRSIIEIEQMAVFLRTTIPPILYGFFEECKKQGFLQPEAFELTAEYFRMLLDSSLNVVQEDDEDDEDGKRETNPPWEKD
jgi:hypothetical protein